MVVTVGSPEGGKQFCEALPFPAELLYLDDAQRRLYSSLQLKSGIWAMFNSETAQAWKGKKTDELKDVLGKYKMIAPPSLESTTQMGGLYVLSGDRCLYAYQDPGVGVHAPNEEVLQACCAATA